MRDEKLKVLRGLRRMSGNEVLTNVVRGQYTAGAVNGSVVPGFTDEIGHPTATEVAHDLIGPDRAYHEAWRVARQCTATSSTAAPVGCAVR